jgi:hypothetical protein
MRRSRLLIAAVMVVVALLGYYASREMNPITGKTQSVGVGEVAAVQSAGKVKGRANLALRFGSFSALGHDERCHGGALRGHRGRHET